MPDLTSHIQFGSVLPKEAWIILCKTSLVPIWMAWSGFGQKHLVWKQASVQESLSLVLAERNRPATSFPLLDSVAFRWHGSDLVLADCVRFSVSGQMDLVQKQASVQVPYIGPASGQHFQADLDGM